MRPWLHRFGSHKHDIADCLDTTCLSLQAVFPAMLICIPIYCEHIPAIICYGLTKTEFTAFLAFSHRLDADILDTNNIIFVYQIASFLMQKFVTVSELISKLTASPSTFFIVRVESNPLSRIHCIEKVSFLSKL